MSCSKRVPNPFGHKNLGNKYLTAVYLVGEVLILNDINWKVHSRVVDVLQMETDHEVKNCEEELIKYFFAIVLILQKI